MKLNEEMKFEILQEMSGNFLCDNIPDEWNHMDAEEQSEFLTNHAWEPLEYMDADSLFDSIDSAAISMINFIEKNIK